MDWHWFLFSFKGRINRAKCWFAVFVILDLMVFLALVVVAGGKLLGVPTSFQFSVYNIFEVVDPQSIRAWHSASFISLVFHAMATPLFLWVFAATAIKRLHDRDRSGWWLVPFFVVPGLYGQFEDRLGDSYAVIAIDIITTVFTIWGLIELYCLKGTRGTNRFGPNPLPTSDDKSDGGAAPAGS